MENREKEFLKGQLSLLMQAEDILDRLIKETLKDFEYGKGFNSELSIDALDKINIMKLIIESELLHG